ncbi:MAG TPA: NTP transferase domain-containing protein [Verrucomicrobiae bacterium]|nr:NTP transferase domain-containing protein [Verrucomicrobiae bacterium]
MNAIIYAAGRATRIGREFAHRPKILLEFGGRTLLEWHALRLSAAGAQNVFVVTGHEHLQIRPLLSVLGKRYGVRLEEIYNPDYCEGSVLSMMVSLPQIQKTKGHILLMDGDVLYDARMLRVLVTSPPRTALLIDRNYSMADDEPVLVPVREGRPIDFAKGWKGQADFVGESVGFFKLSAADVPLLVHETCARLAGVGRLDSLDEVLRALVKQGRFGVVDVTGMAWTEIDFPHDVGYARREVLPRLLHQEAVDERLR